MKTFLKITALAAITVALLGPARLFASQPAEPAQTYHGTLTGSTFYCNGEQSGFRPIVTGTWNLIIDPQTPAQLTLNVFVNGRHDVAFGNNALMLSSYVGGVYVFSAFGGFAMATLDTSVTPATFSWHVEFGGGCPPARPFNSLTFLWSGGPRAVEKGRSEGSSEFTKALKSSVKTSKPANQTTL